MERLREAVRQKGVPCTGYLKRPDNASGDRLAACFSGYQKGGSLKCLTIISISSFIPFVKCCVESSGRT